MLEYDPQPPFNAGSPKTAAEAVVENVANTRKAAQAARKAIVRRAAERLPGL